MENRQAGRVSFRVIQLRVLSDKYTEYGQSEMSKTIPAEMRVCVDHVISSGRFQSEDEILAEALGLWRQREEDLDRLRAKLQSGIDQIDRGEVVDGEIVMQRLHDKFARMKMLQT